MDDKEMQNEEDSLKKLGSTAARGGLNYATGGSWERVRNAPIIGAAAKKAEDKAGQVASRFPLKNVTGKVAKKLDDSGVVDAANKGMSLLGGKKDKDDVGKNKLKNSQSKKGGMINNFLKKGKNGDSTESSSEESENSDDTSSDATETIDKLKKIKLIISIIAILAPILLILMIIITIITIISSVIGIPIVTSNNYGTDKFVANNDTNNVNYPKEMNYYKKIKELEADYLQKCNVKLNSNYIHTSLIYLYYQIDFSELMENGTDIYIDYDKMSEMSDTIYELMQKDNECDIDYEVNGTFYSNLKESPEFKNYYKDLLTEDNIDDTLDNIFELAKDIDFDYNDESRLFLSTKLQVRVDGKEIAVKDYLAGAIYKNVSKDDLSNEELVKAYAIVYTNHLINNGRFSQDNLKVTISNDEYCDINSSCNGKSLTSEEKSIITKAVNSVYGNVLAGSGSTYDELDIYKITVSGNYEKILADSYPEYKIKNILENTYDTGTNYGDGKVLTDVIFYDQNDYGNVKFCGRSNATIKTSGCGTTAMAIIVSTYENSNKYDPIYEMQRAYSWGYCGKGISGTAIAFFKKEANSMKYKYLKVGKSKTSDLNLVLSHLSKGDLVIAHMGPGHFTSGGHYMVLGGIDPGTKKVYVYDPYNKANKANKNRRTGNGWYSFNDIIAKEAFGFYIIWKG